MGKSIIFVSSKQSMSMIKGVITGDLVNSTNIAAEWRQAVVGALYKCAADFSPLTPINIEMYRGDSFQVVVGNPEYALTVAVAFRAKLRASTPERLTISTPWCDFNKSIELVTRFADEVVSSWTAKQANVVYHSLMSPKTQKDMAVELGLSKQNFNSHWTSAKVQLILDYLEYYKTLIVKYNQL